MSDLTRRGFLSLCISLPVLAKLPAEAEPIVQSTLPIVPSSNFEIVRYALGLQPDSLQPIEPGRITVLRGLASILMRPDRLMLNCPGFSLLHLNSRGGVLLEDEVPSEMFLSTGYGMRMMFDSIQPGQEIVLAAINRSQEPQVLMGSLLGSGVQEISLEEQARREERKKYFEFWYCDADTGSDDDCEEYVEFDNRKGLPEGWTFVGENGSARSLHYCPKHSK